MYNIDWVNSLFYFGLISALILTFVTAFIIIIIRAVKKRSIKVPMILLLAITVTFSITAGCIAFSNYQKDKWFYSFKSTIINQNKIVKNIELHLSPVGLSLFVYCDKNADKKDIEPVFDSIRNYLFKNSSGENPSQQSFLKRGRIEYTNIDISFYTTNPKKSIASYESGYYMNGLQEKIDNFSTWRIDGNGEEPQIIIK